MSTYNGGRRGPNVSQYLRDLNAISPSEPEENFAMEDDLAMFTNAQFFDFETGQTTEYHPSKAMETTEAPSVASPTSESTMGDMSGIDFITGELRCVVFCSVLVHLPTIDGQHDSPSPRSSRPGQRATACWPPLGSYLAVHLGQNPRPAWRARG